MSHPDITTCDWQLPRGSNRLCAMPTQLYVEREQDTDFPICGTHLVDYIALHGPQTVRLDRLREYDVRPGFTGSRPT